MKNIPLREALSIMNEKALPFQIRFVTLDQGRKQGGKIIELTKATTVGAKYNMASLDMISVKQIGNNNHPYPVHIHLITEFNNQKVHF